MNNMNIAVVFTQNKGEVKMLNVAGIEFKSESDMLEFVEDKLYWLKTHNKNLTKDQLFITEMLFDIIYQYRKFGVDNLEEKEVQNENI